MQLTVRENITLPTVSTFDRHCRRRREEDEFD